MKIIRVIKAYHNPFYSDKNFWYNIANQLNGELISFSTNKYNDKFYIHLKNLKIDNYKDVDVDIDIDIDEQGTKYKPKFGYFISFYDKRGLIEIDESYRDSFPENANLLKESIKWTIDNYFKENEDFEQDED